MKTEGRTAVVLAWNLYQLNFVRVQTICRYIMYMYLGSSELAISWVSKLGIPETLLILKLMANKNHINWILGANISDKVSDVSL